MLLAQSVYLITVRVINKTTINRAEILTIFSDSTFSLSFFELTRESNLDNVDVTVVDLHDPLLLFLSIYGYWYAGELH